MLKVNRVELSAYEIIEAFPVECQELLEKNIKRLRKELKPWLDAAKHIDNQPWPHDWKMVAIMRIDGIKPKKKFEEYAKMMAVAKLMNAPKFDGQITQADIMMAKQVPIETLYDGWERKRKHKTGFMARCPLGTHVDKTPSFGVKNNAFKCFGCGVAGDSIALTMKLHHLDFPSAVKFLRKI